MTRGNQTYTSSFKATVALEALGQHKKNLDELSEKYDVPVSLILTWTAQLQRHAGNVFETSTEPTDVVVEREEDTRVDVKIDDENVSHGINAGVMRDDLNLKRLAFWSVLGVVFVIVFSQLLKVMYDQTTMINHEQQAARMEYETSIHKKQSREELSSYGVVDIKKGVYHMPIDSVMNEMAADAQ